MVYESSADIKRTISDISPVATSHKAGLKRVLLSSDESGCVITQMAVTDLKSGRCL